MRQDYLQEIREYNIRQCYPDPNSCALLIIDMQNAFTPIASQIKDNLLSIIDKCNRKNMDIIYTRHGHKDLSKDGGMLAEWWGDNIEYGTKSWGLLSQFIPERKDTILDKNRYSAFHNTNLDQILKNKGIDELIITGVLTNCCCETTARDGFVRDYRIFFISDATATVNTELHLASLKNLAFGFAYVLSTSQLIENLS